MRTKPHHGADGVTHTYAVLDLSPESYKEIRVRLIAAGYGHAIEGDEQGEVIDMAGIAVSEEEPITVSDFIGELTSLINCHSRENESDTPDFLLAQFLEDCLKSYGNLVKKRDEWSKS